MMPAIEHRTRRNCGACDIGGGRVSSDLSTPLDVLLHVMRRHWREGRVEDAVALAKAAAPYLHPRAGGQRGGVNLATIGDDALDDLCSRGDAGEGPAAGNTD